jgi:hypothetical protein
MQFSARVRPIASGTLAGLYGAGSASHAARLPNRGPAVLVADAGAKQEGAIKADVVARDAGHLDIPIKDVARLNA